MLANPGLTPGSGDGMAFSSTVKPSATAAMRATWWSSAVVFSRIRDAGDGIRDCSPVSCLPYPDSCFSVVEAVIFFLSARQFDAHFVRQADGDFASLLQPALAHAVLPRAGVA